jgi:hypothetical protein
MERTGTNDYEGVSGWLLLFCCILTIAVPLSTLNQVCVHTIPLISKTHSLKRQILWSAYAAMFLGVGSFALVVGVRLWMVCADAVRLAKLWLLVFLSAHVSYFCLWLVMFRWDRTSSVAKVGWDHVVAPLCSFLLWITYLEHSKRVRNTYKLETAESCGRVSKAQDPASILD